MRNPNSICVKCHCQDYYKNMYEADQGLNETGKKMFTYRGKPMEMDVYRQAINDFPLGDNNETRNLFGISLTLCPSCYNQYKTGKFEDPYPLIKF